MTTLEHDFGLARGGSGDRHHPGAVLFRRIVASLRGYAASRRSRRALRQLSDRTLIDIGVDPRSVRDSFSTIKLDDQRAVVVNPWR